MTFQPFGSATGLGRAAAWVLAASVATAGCGAARHAPVVSPPGAIAGLELLGEFNIPALTEFDQLKNARLGGLSGLAMDPRSGELLAISDDRDTPRVFVFQLPPLQPGRPFRVDLYAYFPLPPHPDAPGGLDPEGIAITRGGRLFIASEGLQTEVPRIPPAIVEYTRNYEFVRQLAVPAKFIPPARGPITRGVRNNASFESLTLTPSERLLYTATESPLAQDGPAATVTTGGLVRVLEYEASGETYAPRREFAYPIDPLGPIDFVPGFLISGLVEMLALSETEFLAMERGYAQEEGEGENRRSTNLIKIYRTSTTGATDISGHDSIRGRQDVRPMRKTLLLDLSTVDGLSEELANLDNFEGMAFGPPLPDGSRTLIIVSDDNFNTAQRTSFLLFRVVE